MTFEHQQWDKRNSRRDYHRCRLCNSRHIIPENSLIRMMMVALIRAHPHIETRLLFWCQKMKETSLRYLLRNRLSAHRSLFSTYFHLRKKINSNQKWAQKLPQNRRNILSLENIHQAQFRLGLSSIWNQVIWNSHQSAPNPRVRRLNSTSRHWILKLNSFSHSLKVGDSLNEYNLLMTYIIIM